MFLIKFSFRVIKLFEEDIKQTIFMDHKSAQFNR